MTNFYVSLSIISEGPRALTIYDKAIGGTRDENARDNSRPIPLCFLHLPRICKKIGNKIGSEIRCFFCLFFQDCVLRWDGPVFIPYLQYTG